MPTRRFPSGEFASFNAFESVVSAADSGNGVGWFFYSQAGEGRAGALINDPCNTHFVGFFSAVHGFADTWSLLQTLDGPFPTVRVGGADYVGALKGGLPGGVLFPTWHKAVPSECGRRGLLEPLIASCQGAVYDLVSSTGSARYRTEDCLYNREKKSRLFFM